MKAIKKILFPTDFSDAALNAFRYCLLLADKLEADIELIHVIYPEYENLDLPVVASKATKDKMEAAKYTLQSFVDWGLAQVQLNHNLEQPPTINSTVEIGNIVNAVVKCARTQKVDLIILGRRSEHTFFEKAFGSVTTGVIEKSDSAVMVIPEKREYHPTEVIAYATDLSEADPYHIWKTGQWLSVFHPVLHIVHISTKDQNGHVDLSEMEQFFENQAPALQVRFHTIESKSVSEGLETFADWHSVDIMVMYAPQHNLVQRIFQKSQTKAMAMNSDIPILLIKEE
jgi:nucleotide-binding universal stress UspA family protein